MTNQRLQNLKDEQLISQYQATGDSQCFDVIYHRYHKKVYCTCLCIVRDRDVASDMVQDVMVKVMENLSRLKSGFLLGLWINRIAKNHSIDYCKNRNRNQLVSIDERLHVAEEEADTEALQNTDKLIEDIQQNLSKLGADDRRLLTLKYFHNCSIGDLQKQLALSESAVKMRLARARKRMVSLYPQRPIDSPLLPLR